jgi:ABC-2 type transport system ATP-binding protein
MGEDIAIKVDRVSKDFVLPHEKVTSVKSAFTSLLNRNRTKEAQHALKDVSFEVKKGEFFGIVGRNGSGKSTMLKILANIYQPTKGNVQTHGKLVPFIELGVGFNPELTGRENVFLNGAMLGFSRKEIEAMYNDIVTFAELERFMDQKLKNYSSGMQVRLAFSMATRSEADILLVDEVLAVGDADFQRKCFEYFRELKKNKKTVVFVSHDMSAVREFCDKAILINESRLVKKGSSETIAQEYTKLFTSRDEEQTGSSEKWGAGGIDIEKISTSKNSYTERDEFVDIQVTVRALRDFVDGILTGITIKNEMGQPVCGTNNSIVGRKNLMLKAGESAVQTWRVPNIFNEGNFMVEPAALDGSNMQVCAWWTDALQFHVINREKTPYIVAPRIVLKSE